MDLEDAVLLEGERVDRLELDMEDTARRVGLRERRLCAAKSGVHTLVVDEEDAALRVGNLLCAMIQNVLLGDVGAFAHGPIDLDEIGGANCRRVGLGENHDPAGHRARRVVEGEAADISLHARAAESSIERTLQSLRVGGILGRA